MLTSIRRRLKIAETEGAYTKYSYEKSDVCYLFHDRELGEWFNATREEILKILSSICQEVGIHELKFARRVYRW